MKLFKSIVFCSFMLFLPFLVQAQHGFDPNEMIAREKQNLYADISDLNEDQKMLIEGIYDEYGLSINELREEIRRTGDYRSMRPKFEALSKEKDDLMRDVLNEDQYVIYENLINASRERRRQNSQNRRDSTNVNPNN